jgi:hypothetical protein
MKHPAGRKGQADGWLYECVKKLGAEVRNMKSIVKLVGQFVREDAEAPGVLRWGHHVSEDGRDLGMGPDEFAIKASDLLRKLRST